MIILTISGYDKSVPSCDSCDVCLVVFKTRRELLTTSDTHEADSPKKADLTKYKSRSDSDDTTGK